MKTRFCNFEKDSRNRSSEDTLPSVDGNRVVSVYNIVMSVPREKSRNDPIHYLRGGGNTGTASSGQEQQQQLEEEDLLHTTTNTTTPAQQQRRKESYHQRSSSMNDMRRTDSDDEGPAVTVNLCNDSSHDNVETETASSEQLDVDNNDTTVDRVDIQSLTVVDDDEGNQSSNKDTKTSCGLGIVQPNRAYRKQSNEMALPPARARPEISEAWPYREALSFTRSLVFYGTGSITKEHERACAYIQTARTYRQSYYGRNSIVVPYPELVHDRCRLSYGIGREGVAELYHNIKHPTVNLVQVPNVEQFQQDYHKLVEITSEGVMRSFCFQRLQILSTSYKMHTTLNSTVEMEEQNRLLGTDFYRTMKVDNHIHAAAAPSAKQFVQFVRDKLQTEADTIVTSEKVMRPNPVTHETEEVIVEKTLAQVYEEAGLDMDHLTIDAFNVLADYSVYQRFDNFNSKYSPFKLADMRRIFLKTTNTNGGRYFAELLKIVLNRHELSKGHNSTCEMRLSISGMERHEWYDLAKWMLTDWKHPDFPGPMISSSNRWLIQVPRLWRIYCQKKPLGAADGQQAQQRTFLEMIENLFVPLFDATLDPDSHPEIAEAMKHIVGFDSVDDEGALEVGT
jgi:AMP deaminase